MRGLVVDQDVSADFESRTDDEEVIAVYCWRLEELLRAGYAHVVADALAGNPAVDLHLACDLLSSGCPQGIAFRIVS